MKRNSQISDKHQLRDEISLLFKLKDAGALRWKKSFSTLFTANHKLFFDKTSTRVLLTIYYSHICSFVWGKIYKSPLSSASLKVNDCWKSDPKKFWSHSEPGWCAHYWSDPSIPQPDKMRPIQTKTSRYQAHTDKSRPRSGFSSLWWSDFRQILAKAQAVEADFIRLLINTHTYLNTHKHTHTEKKMGKTHKESGTFCGQNLVFHANILSKDIFFYTS